jgi:glycosyltransferase involved in cell wall biosynthesis
MRYGKKVAAVIPALNEEKTIGLVLDAIPDWIDRIVLGDNGSTDTTREIAAEHGAEVAREPRRGYGRACMAAVSRLAGSDAPDVVVFLDGDFSDDPIEMNLLVDPAVHEDRDLVIGSRILGRREKGALSVQQRFGSWLASQLIRALFGVRYTDLGPFRAVKWSSLKMLGMDHPGYGWTVQMQVRAARLGMKIKEVPVSYRRRAGGKSKVSGTIRGVLGASAVILFVIFKEGLAARIKTARPPRTIAFTAPT